VKLNKQFLGYAVPNKRIFNQFSIITHKTLKYTHDFSISEARTGNKDKYKIAEIGTSS